VEEFSIDSISRSAPIHSRKKLEWLNSHYIRQETDNQLSELLLPYLDKVGLHQVDRNYLNKISRVLKGNLTVLSQVEEYLGIFFDEKFSFDHEAKTLLLDFRNQETLQICLNLLQDFPEIAADTWPSVISQLEEKTGRKGKDLYGPLRAGITGRTRGPELAKTLPLLGKERILRRLKMALQINQNPNIKIQMLDV
jgi:glutamyl/glutaminyl-tRNA synthetase